MPNIQAYAVGMVIYCPAATGLRHLLRNLDELLAYHELLFNISEMKIVIFKADLRNVSNLLFIINGILYFLLLTDLNCQAII